MVTRIIRSKPVNKTSEIERLMKSISEAQARIAKDEATVKADIPALYALMKAQGLDTHRVDNIVAELYRSAGRATNLVDPKAFRALVADDKEFYSAVSVSITKAREVLPKKQLDSITTTIPAKPGEETVKVSQWNDKT